MNRDDYSRSQEDAPTSEHAARPTPAPASPREPSADAARVSAAPASPTSAPTTLPEGVDPKKLYRRGLERTDSFRDTQRIASAAKEAFRWLDDDTSTPAAAPKARLPQPSIAALDRADDEGMIAPPSKP